MQFLNLPALSHVLDLLGLLLHGHFVEGSHGLLELMHWERVVVPDVVLAFVLAGAGEVELGAGGFLVFHVPQPHSLQLVLVAEHPFRVGFAGIRLVYALFVGSPESFVFDELVLLEA